MNLVNFISERKWWGKQWSIGHYCYLLFLMQSWNRVLFHPISHHIIPVIILRQVFLYFDDKERFRNMTDILELLGVFLCNFKKLNCICIKF